VDPSNLPESRSAEQIGNSRTKRQWQAHAELAMSKGERADAVLSGMIHAGCPEADAREIVQRALEVQRKAANRLLGCSGAFMSAGIIITAATYSAATSAAGGGTYYIWYGAIICGAIGVIVALCRRSSLGP